MKKGDVILDKLVFEAEIPKEGYWDMFFSFDQHDWGPLGTIRREMGSADVDFMFTNGTWTNTWNFHSSVYAVAPHPRGINSYGFSMFGRDTYYKCIAKFTKEE